nr:hypothetical protein [Tanacetum cinerariifolium]
MGKPGLTSIGGLLRNTDGVVLAIFSISVGVLDPNVAKVMTINKAYSMIKEKEVLRFVNITIQSESLNSVCWVNRLDERPRRLLHHFYEIDAFLFVSSNRLVTHIKREHNNNDDKLAKEVYLDQFHWIQSPKLGFSIGNDGALALIQLQEDMKKQPSAERKYTKEELKEYMNSHKKRMIDSLWKLNMTDIKATLSCVLQDPTVKKEELRARAKGLRTLSRIFQKAKSISETESEPILHFGVDNLNGVDQDHSSRDVEPKQSFQTTMAPQNNQIRHIFDINVLNTILYFSSKQSEAYELQ